MAVFWGYKIFFTMSRRIPQKMYKIHLRNNSCTVITWSHKSAHSSSAWHTHTTIVHIQLFSLTSRTRLVNVNETGLKHEKVLLERSMIRVSNNCRAYSPGCVLCCCSEPCELFKRNCTCVSFLCGPHYWFWCLCFSYFWPLDYGCMVAWKSFLNYFGVG